MLQKYKLPEHIIIQTKVGSKISWNKLSPLVQITHAVCYIAKGFSLSVKNLHPNFVIFEDRSYKNNPDINCRTGFDVCAQILTTFCNILQVLDKSSAKDILVCITHETITLLALHFKFILLGFLIMQQYLQVPLEFSKKEIGCLHFITTYSPQGCRNRGFNKSNNVRKKALHPFECKKDRLSYLIYV